MEYTTNRKAVAVCDPTLEPRKAAVVAKYGDFDKFNERWSVNNMRSIAANAELSVERGVPTLGMMIATYSKDCIQQNLVNLLIGLVYRMGETNIAPENIKTIAESITDSTPLRYLNYAFVVRFFSKIEQGEYKLYSCKPHQFMNAFQEYAKDAIMVQRALEADAESRRKAVEWEEHRKSAISFDEFKRRTGYRGDNPIQQTI